MKWPPHIDLWDQLTCDSQATIGGVSGSLRNDGKEEVQLTTETRNPIVLLFRLNRITCGEKKKVSILYKYRR
jgi:hypothetical protein